MIRAQTKIEITTDRLLINGVSSVEVWERPIQKKLVEAVVSLNDVVAEVGYGLGMASEAIQKISTREHWIIEAHHHTLVPLLEKQPLSANLIISSWQTALPMIKEEYFHAIVYDADPDDRGVFDGSAEATLKFVSPILPHALRILKPGGKLGFIDFSGALRTLPEFHVRLAKFNLDFNFVSVPINPPPKCNYARNRIGDVITIIKPNSNL
ncbi:MAG: hypothetical protein HY940_02265 [Gammaproteobacteria bacterium]|nr:hypothetical protein [Gammaproteobacteria bacterium]